MSHPHMSSSSRPRSHVIAWAARITTLAAQGKQTPHVKTVPFTSFTHPTDIATSHFSVGQSVKCDVQTEGDASVLARHAVFSLNRKTGELTLDGKVKHGDVWVAPLGSSNVDAWRLLVADDVVDAKSSMLRISQCTTLNFGPEDISKAAGRSPKKLKRRKRSRPTEADIIDVDGSSDDDIQASAPTSTSPVKKRAKSTHAKTKAPVKRLSTATPVAQTKKKMCREVDTTQIDNNNNTSNNNNSKTTVATDDAASTHSTDTHTTTPPTRARAMTRAPLLNIPSPSHHAARRPSRMPSRRIACSPTETTSAASKLHNSHKTLNQVNTTDLPLVQQQFTRILPVSAIMAIDEGDAEHEDNLTEMDSTTDFLALEYDSDVDEDVVADSLQLKSEKRKSMFMFVRVVLVAVGVALLLFATITMLQRERQERIATVSTTLMPDVPTALLLHSDAATVDTTSGVEFVIDDVAINVVAEEEVVEIVEEIVEEEEFPVVADDQNDKEHRTIELKPEEVFDIQVASVENAPELPVITYEEEEQQIKQVDTFTLADKMSATTFHGGLATDISPRVFVSAVHFDKPRTHDVESGMLKRVQQASTESARWFTRVGSDACFWLPATIFGVVGVDLQLPAAASGACHLGMDVRVTDGDGVVLGASVGVLRLGAKGSGGGFMCEHVVGLGKHKYAVSLTGGAPTTLRVSLEDLQAPLSGELCARGLYLECE